MSRLLYVYKNMKLVGKLTENHGKFFEFQYEKDAEPISLTMPYQNEPYNNRLSKPFFENMLPEGDILKTISEIYGVSERNPFSLLNVIGEDCAGSISLTPEIIKNTITPAIKIEDTDYLDMLNKFSSGIAYYKKGMRLSVAGVQNKTTIILKDNDKYYPDIYNPSTHILKFDTSHVSNILINELFCTMLAKKLGIQTSDMELVEEHKINYLLIKRFDRLEISDNIIRINQEDFMQLASIESNRKYQSEGGPSFLDISNLIDKYLDNKMINKLKLAKIMVYNFLIGNGDYHGKNFSVLVNEKIEFTSFYDLVSTSVYEDLDQKIAMSINKKYLYEKITRDDLINEMDKWGLKGDKILPLILNDFRHILDNANILITKSPFKENKEFLNKIVNYIEHTYNKIS